MIFQIYNLTIVGCVIGFFDADAAVFCPFCHVAIDSHGVNSFRINGFASIKIGFRIGETSLTVVRFYHIHGVSYA